MDVRDAFPLHVDDGRAIALNFAMILLAPLLVWSLRDTRQHLTYVFQSPWIALARFGRDDRRAHAPTAVHLDPLVGLAQTRDESVQASLPSLSSGIFDVPGLRDMVLQKLERSDRVALAASARATARAVWAAAHHAWAWPAPSPPSKRSDVPHSGATMPRASSSSSLLRALSAAKVVLRELGFRELGLAVDARPLETFAQDQTAATTATAQMEVETKSNMTPAAGLAATATTEPTASYADSDNQSLAQQDNTLAKSHNAADQAHQKNSGRDNQVHVAFPPSTLSYFPLLALDFRAPEWCIRFGTLPFLVLFEYAFTLAMLANSTHLYLDVATLAYSALVLRGWCRRASPRHRQCAFAFLVAMRLAARFYAANALVQSWNSYDAAETKTASPLRGPMRRESNSSFCPVGVDSASVCGFGSEWNRATNITNLLLNPQCALRNVALSPSWWALADAATRVVFSEFFLGIKASRGTWILDRSLGQTLPRLEAWLYVGDELHLRHLFGMWIERAWTAREMFAVALSFVAPQFALLVYFLGLQVFAMISRRIPWPRPAAIALRILTWMHGIVGNRVRRRVVVLRLRPVLAAVAALGTLLYEPGRAAKWTTLIQIAWCLGAAFFGEDLLDALDGVIRAQVNRVARVMCRAAALRGARRLERVRVAVLAGTPHYSAPPPQKPAQATREPRE